MENSTKSVENFAILVFIGIINKLLRVAIGKTY